MSEYFDKVKTSSNEIWLALKPFFKDRPLTDEECTEMMETGNAILERWKDFKYAKDYFMLLVGAVTSNDVIERRKNDKS